MKLNKRYSYFVLCEDAQMKSFIVSFLRYHDVDSRHIYVRNYPCGAGCGEAFVRLKYPDEVKLLRTKNYNSNVLVVCTDADNKTVKERMDYLDKGVIKDNSGWSRQIEPIMLFVPKRQIETWLRFLRGNDVNEYMEFGHSGNPVTCKEEAKKFALYCQDRLKLDVKDIKSLEIAKSEYIRVCKIQV